MSTNIKEHQMQGGEEVDTMHVAKIWIARKEIASWMPD